MDSRTLWMTLILTTVLAGASQAQDVLIPCGGIRHTGVVETQALLESPAVKWRFEANGKVFGPPLIDAGRVYFGDADGNLYALDAASGVEQWTFKAQDRINACPSLHGDQAIFGSIDGFLYSVDKRTGALRWKFKTGAGASCSPPAIHDDIVYCGSHDKNFYLVDVDSGEEIQRLEVGHGVCSAAAVDGATFYFTDWSGALRAVDLKTREDRWIFKSRGKAYDSPSLDDTRVYFASFDSTLYAIDRETGREAWHYQANSVPAHAVLAETRVYCNTMDGDLIALDKDSGSLVWQFETEGQSWSEAVLVGEVLYFGSGDQHLYAVDAKTGRQLWRFKAEDAVQRPNAHEGVVYFSSGSSVYALE